MKVLLKLFGGLAVLVLLLLAVAFFFPRAYHVERSTVIQAKPEVVFAQVADLKAWKNWGVWFERDPQMQVTYSEPTTGVGAWSAWKSATEGNGKATLVALTPGTYAEYKLEFEGWENASKGTFSLAVVPEGTHLTWSDEGDLGNSPVARWFGLFLDKMIGPDFEAGLAKLKTVCEGGK